MYDRTVTEVTEQGLTIDQLAQQTGMTVRNIRAHQSRGLLPAYDGITEFWWDDAAAVNEVMASPEGEKAMQMLIEDESKFIDFSQSRVFMTTEHVIFD